MKGKLDDVAIYKRELSEEEVGFLSGKYTWEITKEGNKTSELFGGMNIKDLSGITEIKISGSKVTECSFVSTFNINPEPEFFKINTIGNRSFTYEFKGAGLEANYNSPSLVIPPLTALPVEGVTTIELKILSDEKTVEMLIYFDLNKNSEISNLMYSLNGGLTRLQMPESAYELIGKELFLLGSNNRHDATIYPMLLSGKCIDVTNQDFNILKFNGISELSDITTMKLEVFNNENELLNVNPDFTWAPSENDISGLYKYKLSVDTKIFEGFFVLNK